MDARLRGSDAVLGEREGAKCAVLVVISEGSQGISYPRLKNRSAMRLKKLAPRARMESLKS